MNSPSIQQFINQPHFSWEYFYIQPHILYINPTWFQKMLDLPALGDYHLLKPLLAHTSHFNYCPHHFVEAYLPSYFLQNSFPHHLIFIQPSEPLCKRRYFLSASMIMLLSQYLQLPSQEAQFLQETAISLSFFFAMLTTQVQMFPKNPYHTMLQATLQAINLSATYQKPMLHFFAPSFHRMTQIISTNWNAILEQNPLLTQEQKKHLATTIP